MVLSEEALREATAALQLELSKQVALYVAQGKQLSVGDRKCPIDDQPLSYARVGGGGLPTTHIFQCRDVHCNFKVTASEPLAKPSKMKTGSQ